MYKTRDRYLAADPEGRAQLLLELIRTHAYFIALNQLVAREDPALIDRIIDPLWRTYPHFFDDLLCEIARVQGLDVVANILKRYDFASRVAPTELAQVDRYLSSDNNPLTQLYHEFGPAAFITLYEAGAVSLRQLYLWIRSQYVRDQLPQHENFIVALATRYADSFVRAPMLISECFVIELDIAATKGRNYLLKDHLGLIIRIQDCLDHESFGEFLIYLSTKLRGRRIGDAIENLVFLEFLRYANAAQIPLVADESCHIAYWRWLLSSPSDLSSLLNLLPPPGNS